MVLFPVVLPVLEVANSLLGKEKVGFLSRTAREALRLSAEKSGVVLGELKKDKDGSPLPFDGNYWSLSHKPRCVAAVIGRERIGIDVEEIIPRPEALFGYLATEEEWKLSEEMSLDTFFRYWTAKEATLKSVGRGIGELKRCRVISIRKRDHFVLEYHGRFFSVEQLSYQNHIISVVKDNNEIEWAVSP
jgi:4'-phosphopantetheinyl transferase